MQRKLTQGKLAGLKAVSNDRGVIAAAALDQRGMLKKMMAKQAGGGEPPDAMITEFKELVTAALTPYASAILLDVEYGLPAMKHRHGKGVMLAYEKSGYDATAPEFIPSVTEGWSVLRLKEAGAAAVKTLVYYTPFEKPWVNEQKKAWVERVGAECRALDMPLFLEFLGYDVLGETGLAYAKRKPEIVIHSIEEFSKDRYAGDVLKVEVPVQMQFVAGTEAFQGEQAYSRVEAQEYFRNVAAAAALPFVYLSAGVTNAAFVETLEFAVESGAHFHGVLCGRATWQDAVPVFVHQGAKACEKWLAAQGAENIRKVNHVLEAASPWHEKFDLG
ncbi:MAG: tagatose 1,6-diphosphate aldolase [Bryobacteraceae bacterium]